MIIQLHWQNPQNPDETEFVAQADIEELEQTPTQPMDWIKTQIVNHIATCPAGWIAMTCWGDHPAMVLAAKKAAV